MALNQYMHPRNKYKTPPDFSMLAQTFPEFSMISKYDISGKVTIDFKDPKSLRILTKCLLKSDFNVDIDIPEDRLVPTLPLRLNYILWIEDIMMAIERKTNIHGIDIGTGACAIYPILGCLQNKWKMTGTESDEKSLQKAQENIEKNNLDNMIKLFKNTTSTVVSEVLENDSDQIFDFCMCNPPFYSSIQELCESRDTARQEPKNGFTGSPQELITEGGELNFCKKLITESKAYKDRIRIFTTMIGHKYNFKEIINELNADGVKYTHTEFCQGRVTRWGIAWTYQDFDIFKLIPPRDKIRKKNSIQTYLLPQITNCMYDVNTCCEKVQSLLQKLNLNFKIVNRRGTNVLMEFMATENTWSHQRRKRRLMKMIEANESKKPKISAESTTNDSLGECSSGATKNTDFEKLNNNNIDKSVCSDSKGLASEDNKKELLVHAFLKVFKKDKEILLQVDFLSGSAGKEGLHQIVQYIKNNWK